MLKSAVFPRRARRLTNRWLRLSLVTLGLAPVLLLLLLFSVCPASGQGPSGSLAPLNPRFVEYLARHGENRVTLEAPSGFATGAIPSPLDLSHLKRVPQAERRPLDTYPASLDLRSEGRLTAVRNQGACGCCWSFAAMGSVESNLLPTETLDFSENNLKNTHGFDYGPCEGGNSKMAAAYLARWAGPVLEADDPYSASSGTSPGGLTTQKHLQQALLLPGRQTSTDNDRIKHAVTTYGAVIAYMYWNPSYYNSGTYAYYYSGAPMMNHAITIVGWDDTYSRNNFPTTPPGDGAFIVRNSWGTYWGDAGYFYISYYDTSIDDESMAVFNSLESTTSYTRVYQYDTLGWIMSYGYGSTSGWFANVFTAAATEHLSAVSFYAASPGSSYEIRIYRGVTSGPTTGTLGTTKTGSIADAGYHTITLDDAVAVTSGQRFSVVAKLTTPGYTMPIPLETPITNYSSGAAANAGEGYVSYNGSSWEDITESYTNASVCLKAFATAADPGSLTLTQGWNLISMPLQPSDTAIGTVLAGLSGNYTIVWGYPNQAWKFYDPTDPEGSTLTTLEAGNAYWIRMTSAATLTLTGTTPSTSVGLGSGWNLAGYNTTSSGATSSALSTIAGSYTIVWGYPVQAWRFFDPTDEEGSTLTQFSPGGGYWIKTTTATTWTLP